MTRDELLGKLRATRAEFDRHVAEVPQAVLDVAPDGCAHSPKEIVAHVVAYEELIVERLKAARSGATTSFDRDRDSWEAFNERIWARSKTLPVEEVLADSARVFGELLEHVGLLTDEELTESTGIAIAIDPGWLQDRPLWEVIGVDGFEHYPMHLPALVAAAGPKV